jgi:hypothetical protein
MVGKRSTTEPHPGLDRILELFSLLKLLSLHGRVGRHGRLMWDLNSYGK